MTDVEVIAYGKYSGQGCAVNAVETAIPGGSLTGYQTITESPLPASAGRIEGDDGIIAIDTGWFTT